MLYKRKYILLCLGILLLGSSLGATINDGLHIPINSKAPIEYTVYLPTANRPPDNVVIFPEKD